MISNVVSFACRAARLFALFAALGSAPCASSLTDEELESAIAFLQEMMAAQAVGSAHLVEMKAEPAALPAPGGQSPEKLSSKRKPNRLMIEVDTAIGPQERIPRRMRAPADE